MNYEKKCEFLEPRDFQGNTPSTSTDFWNYQKMVCSSTMELVENASTGASFYISKEIDYGDILVMTFLTLFLILGIFKFLINFVIPKRINFKR